MTQASLFGIAPIGNASSDFGKATDCRSCSMPSRCDNYHGNTRCPNSGDVWIYAPDGKLTPGGRVCLECARRMVSEYAEKLGETWTFRACCHETPKVETRSDVRRIIQPRAQGKLFIELAAGGVPTGREFRLLEMIDGQYLQEFTDGTRQPACPGFTRTLIDDQISIGMWVGVSVAD